MAEIKIIAGESAGHVFDIGSGIATIGREQTNSIQINDFEISRCHAEIHCRVDEFVLIDLGSSNGTFVNGQKISSIRLTTSDEIQMGRTILEFNEQSFGMGTRIDNPETLANAADESLSDQTIATTLESDPFSQLLKTKSNLQVMYHTALAASSYRTAEELVQRMLDLVFYWIAADRACILIRENEQENLYAKSVDPKSAGKFISDPFEIDYEIVRYVFRQKEGVLVEDIEQDERFEPSIDTESIIGRQIICAPIRSRYGIRGVIYADRRKTPLNEEDSVGLPFDHDHLKLLVAIGLHVAVAVENADYYASLVQSEQATAVGKVMASLSHHIKNILQSINGGNHLIEDGLANQQFELVQSGWQIVQRNQESLSDLVMDMLSFSRPVEPKLRPSDLNEIVVEAIDSVQRRATYSKVSIDFEPVQGLPNMIFEPVLLKRALLNILLIGIGSCRENTGGRIVIEIDHSNDERTTRVRLIDDGVSFTREELQSIFDPLAINEKSSRTGIGMAVCRKMVLELGGEIEAQMNERQGTTFTIQFHETHLNGGQEVHVKSV